MSDVIDISAKRNHYRRPLGGMASEPCDVHYVCPPPAPVPLRINHSAGTITADRDETSFGDRLSRIRESIRKINRLMFELRESSRER